MSTQTAWASAAQRYGNQRDWLWRGWQIRYTFVRNLQSEVPLILVHGFGASIGHWRQNIPALAQHHTVYALDLLGFGASEKPVAPYTTSLWVEQIYEFWQTFIREPAVLVGNSIGSLACLAAAAAHPDMVQGVAMISLPDTSMREEAIPSMARPVVRTIEALFASPLLLQPLFYLVRHPRIVRPWASLAYATREAITDELLEILTTPAQDQGSAGAFCAILKAMISPQFGPSIKAILSDLQIPALLLWGQQDRMIPPALAQRFVSYNPALQLVELENAGHCAHDECPERVNQELLTWLESRVLAASCKLLN
ncbi:alpha/beta fold hydrolase [Leptolyngbya sp. FACHB-261]|nr:alpha/beta fold hydrolase [Leptolyngbya sp. FACHB-261]